MMVWQEWRVKRWSVLLFLAITVLLTGLIGCESDDDDNGGQADTNFRLTILHNNDGESQLINAGEGLEDFGGIARFATFIRNLRNEAMQGSPAGVKLGVILVSSGDNFLAGPEFNASLQKGVPFYDSIGLDLINYDAIAIGNHEFDFGPEVLADFIAGFSSPPFVSANLDFSGEPVLQSLVDAGKIVRSTIVVVNGERVGIVGATTPRLAFISSPRNVRVDPDVAGAVQREVDALSAQGVNKIILISHLQSVEEDLALIPQLRGIDVAVAGGGDELLANPNDRLIPGDEQNIVGPYPLTATDADGNEIPVVTTSGNYKYVGRLIVEFDPNGAIIDIDATSGPIRVAGGNTDDAVGPDPEIQAAVVDPVAAAVEALAQNIIGLTEVGLNGQRSNIRTRETNEGNLIADALRFQATQVAPNFGAPLPDVALQNGGGIRNDSIIGPGDLSELNTFNMLPFANFVSIVPNISATQFKEILENAVSRVEFTDGRFAQISGFRFRWAPTGVPQELDDNGNVTTSGSRVQEVVLNDGTVLVQNGVVVPNAPALNIATIDFLARGGDQYPFREMQFTTLGVTYQQALVNYIQNELGGVITAARYPEGGEGRITTVPLVATDSAPPILATVDGVDIFNGGFGSDMAPVPDTPGQYYLLTDRGPNFDGPADDTKVFPRPDFAPQIGRFRVNGTALQRESVLQLRNAAGGLLTGLPNPPGFGGTGETPLDLEGNVLPFAPEGLDPEGLVALPDGTFWVSDEYGPHIVHFAADGTTIERINPFGNGTGGRRIPLVFAKRRPNRGMEGLTITPDGTTLVGIMQSSLDNPSSAVRRTSQATRILTLNIATGATQQFVYLQERPGLSNSAIIALTNTTFLVLERDGDFPGDPDDPSTIKSIYKIDVSQATDVSDPNNGENGRLFNGSTLEELTVAELAEAGIVPVTKELVLDLLILSRLYPHDKPEGMVALNNRTIAVVNDDDFGITDQGGTITQKILPTTGMIDQNAIWLIQVEVPFTE